MTDVSQQTDATLASLAAELERRRNPNGSPQAVAVADQVIHRAAAAMSDIHAHAMSRVTSMREQLDDLERSIVEAKERAEAHIEKFMRLVTDGEEAIHAMEQVVARISDQVLTPH